MMGKLVVMLVVIISCDKMQITKHYLQPEQVAHYISSTNLYNYTKN